MIPKIIHYCWFGHGEKSPLIKKCIKSSVSYTHLLETFVENSEFDNVECAFVAGVPTATLSAARQMRCV